MAQPESFEEFEEKYEDEWKHKSGPAVCGFRITHHMASFMIPFLGVPAFTIWMLSLVSLPWQHWVWRVWGFSNTMDVGILEFDLDAYQFFAVLHGMVFGGRVAGGIASVFVKDIPNVAEISKHMMPVFNEIEKRSGRNTLMQFGVDCEVIFKKIAATFQNVLDKGPEVLGEGAFSAEEIFAQFASLAHRTEAFMSKRGCKIIKVSTVYAAYSVVGITFTNLIFLHGVYDVFEQKGRVRVLMQLGPTAFANGLYLCVVNRIAAWDLIEDIFAFFFGVSSMLIKLEIQVIGMAMIAAICTVPVYIVVFFIALFWYHPHPPHLHHLYYKQLAATREAEAVEQAARAAKTQHGSGGKGKGGSQASQSEAPPPQGRRSRAGTLVRQGGQVRQG